MKPKKSLGQNFLKDQEILNKIIEAANLSADDLVIEVGPGTGALTEKLIQKAKKVIAIEIDNNLANELDSRLRGNDKIEIIHDDILKINLPELLCNLQSTISNSKEKNLSYKLPITNYKVVANIPYYITSPIIQLFLENPCPPKEMILMVQKEVAERIVATPVKMSLLAIGVQYYAECKILFKVSKNSFFPVPEVDSAVIKITPKIKYDKDESKKFFRVARAGFCAKRKTLSNNLSSSFHLEKKEVDEKLKNTGINPASRAQELSIEDWKKLVKIF